MQIGLNWPLDFHKRRVVGSRWIPQL